MPKLTPLQWLLFAVFLFFYGFTVFAVTRDYYVRTLVRPAVAVTPGSPHSPPTQAAQLPPTTAIPQAITESNLDLLRQQADELFAQRRYSEAVPVYRRILELEPDDVESHNDLGLALYYKGEMVAALTQLRAGVARDPDHQRVWLTLGFVSLQVGDQAEARAALERARELGPDTGVGQEAARLLDLVEDE
jgi:Flp pilus assembly protein TadD